MDNGKKNLMYHIINNEHHNEIDDGIKRYSMKEILAFVGETLAVLVLFGTLIFFLSISDGIDQHLMNYLGD